MKPARISLDRRRIVVLATLGSALTTCGEGSDGGGNAMAATPLPPTATLPPSPSLLSAPPTEGITVTAITPAVTGPVPVTFGQVFKRGDVPAGCTLAGVQLNVKCAWPDGSASIGIVSCLLSGVAGAMSAVGLQCGTAASGPTLTTAGLRATGIAAAVGAGAFGSASWSGADWESPFRAWVTGPVMSSWIYRKPVGGDAHLVAWLEVRMWSNGAVEVLPWVENGYLLVPGPTSKSATYKFTLGGTDRFSQLIDLPHHTRTPLVSGPVTSHWLGAAQDSVVKHDPRYMQATGLVPAYMASVSPAAAVVKNLPASYTPLQQGNWPAGMGAGGYHASIGLLPEWDVLYLTSNAAATYKGVVFNAYSAGRFPCHYRDETNTQQPNRPPRISLHPNLTLMSPSPGWETPPAGSGTQPAGWGASHQPSPGYMAYLVTGRHYFLEELQFAASTNSLAAPWPSRQSAKGIYKSTAAGAARAVAWRWRTLAQAVAATPDDDTIFKAEYLANLKNNVEYYHARYVAKPNNPLGFITPYSDYNGGQGGLVSSGCTTTTIYAQDGLYGIGYNLTADDQFVGWSLTISGETRTITGFAMAENKLTVSPAFSKAPANGTPYRYADGVYFEATWMQDFVTAAWGYSKDIASGLDAPTRAKLDALFEWKAKSVVGRFGMTGSTEFLYRDAAPYSIAIAPSDAPDFDGGAGPWYSNFGEVYKATYAGKTPGGGKPPPYASPGPKAEGRDLRMWLSPEGYLANALPALAYAVKHGAQGALAAYRRLTAASNWLEFKQGLDAEPVWAVTPGELFQSRATPLAFARPAWNRGQAVAEWREVPGSSINALVPANIARTLSGGTAVVGPSSRLDAWCGLSIDTRTSEVWAAANGGHGDYYGNEVVKIDLMSDVPAWIEWFAGSKGNVVDNVTGPSSEHPELARYRDGLPTSAHSYYGQQFLERHNRAIRLGGSMAPYGSGWQDVEAFNVKLAKGVNGWDAPATYPPVFGSPGWTPAIGFCACKDPTTERIYVVQAPSLRRFTPSSAGVGGTWDTLSTLPGALNSGALGGTAIDTKRNRLLWIHGYGPNKPYTCDLTSGAWTAREHPASPAKAAFDTLSQSLGIVYVPHLDAFLVRGNASGPAVYRIDAESFAVSYLRVIGGELLPRGAVLTAEEGVYNRWLSVPRLQGVVYFPRSQANAWFLQL